MDKSNSLTLDDYVIKIYQKIDKRYIVVLIISIITGIVAHGLALFNKFSFHDDTYSLFTVGATFTSGRYMLYELSHFVQNKMGGLFSTPLYEGMITILFISFSCMILVSLLNIKSKVICGSVAAYMICFPVVCGMLGFMFTGCYYAIAIFFTLLGSYFVCKYKKWYTMILGAVLIGNAIGIYQAYIPLFLSTFILCFLKEIFDMGGYKENNKRLILYIPYYVVAGIMPIIVYVLTNNYELRRYGKQLSNYKGIDKMGQMSVEQFFVRTMIAYKRFIFPEEDLFPAVTYTLYVIIICICILLTLCLIICKVKKNAIASIISVAVLAIIPFGFNFSYIMINEEQSVGTLQSYGYVMVIVWFAFLISRVEDLDLKANSVVCGTGLLIIAFMTFTYIRLDNVVYLKAEIMKERSLAYYTELITQIKSVEGYKDSLPVAYIKNGDIDDSTIQELSVWDYFYVHPYCDINYNINYAWWGYIGNWLGFCAERVDATSFENMDEVKEMPNYPDDGAIRIINGTIVVKLADGEED